VARLANVGRKFELEAHDEAWRVQKALMAHLARVWDEPGEGIWEVRGPRRHFTHSKVIWVAFDRAIKGVESFGLSGRLDEWRELRAAIHEDICNKGFDPEKNSFVQYYGGNGVDAALLTACRRGRAPSSPAASGWPMLRPARPVRRRRAAVRASLVVSQRPRPAVDGLVDTFLALARTFPLRGTKWEASSFSSSPVYSVG
jgi:hypothetical protein